MIGKETHGNLSAEAQPIHFPRPDEASRILPSLQHKIEEFRKCKIVETKKERQIHRIVAGLSRSYENIALFRYIATIQRQADPVGRRWRKILLHQDSK